ncbi:MAG: hypothetical protein IJT73_00335 [Selenomonadaceae bacterium]|nr:hypothetical protein [Selenomonadaceae bacterium]
MEDYNPAEAEKLLNDLKNFCLSNGVILVEKISGEDKIFEIQTDKPAFYLDIKSLDDAAKLNEILKEHLDTLKSDKKIFLQNHSKIEENIYKTIDSINLSRAQKFIDSGLKKFLSQYKTVEELREVAGQIYGDFIKSQLIDSFISKLYGELKKNPGVTAYIYIVRKFNQMFAELGITAVESSSGIVYKFKENSGEKFIAEVKAGGK